AGRLIKVRQTDVKAQKIVSRFAIPTRIGQMKVCTKTHIGDGHCVIGSPEPVACRPPESGHSGFRAGSPLLYWRKFAAAAIF
ncbi:MAG: hypothetical protein KJ833_10605, partial [Alphaproteobacteria bacterium]|nr:hypothetical protein [Alphaproteobacteria bacterium]